MSHWLKFIGLVCLAFSWTFPAAAEATDGKRVVYASLNPRGLRVKTLLARLPDTWMGTLAVVTLEPEDPDWKPLNPFVHKAVYNKARRILGKDAVHQLELPQSIRTERQAAGYAAQLGFDHALVVQVADLDGSSNPPHVLLTLLRGEATILGQQLCANAVRWAAPAPAMKAPKPASPVVLPQPTPPVEELEPRLPPDDALSVVTMATCLGLGVGGNTCILAPVFGGLGAWLAATLVLQRRIPAGRMVLAVWLTFVLGMAALIGYSIVGGPFVMVAHVAGYFGAVAAIYGGASTIFAADPAALRAGGAFTVAAALVSAAGILFVLMYFATAFGGNFAVIAAAGMMAYLTALTSGRPLHKDERTLNLDWWSVPAPEQED